MKAALQNKILDFGHSKLSVGGVHIKGRIKVHSKGSWYFTTIFQCPVCNVQTSYKRRNDPPKPDGLRETSEVILRHCGCTRFRP